MKQSFKRIISAALIGAITLLASSANAGGLGSSSGTPATVLLLPTSQNALFDFSGYNNGIALPIGTSGQRPGTPVEGEIRYNSTTHEFEGYGGASPAWGALGGVSSGGTVTSIGMAGDGTIFNPTVPGSPVTSSGTLSPTLKTQAANCVLAGPVSGVSAAPTCRSLVGADIPAPTTSTLGGLFAKASSTLHRVVQYIDTAGNQILAQLACGDLSDGGTACAANVGTSGANVGLLNGNLTFGGNDNFTNPVAIGTTTPATGVALDLGTNTNSLLLPAGTTGQRPTGVAGMLRYNSTIPQVEAYYSGAWNALGGAAGAISSIPLGAGLTITPGTSNASPVVQGSTLYPQAYPNTYTGNHTVGAGEANGLDVCNSGSALTMTLAQAGTTSFERGVAYNFLNVNSGVCSIATSTSTLKGMPLNSGKIDLSQYGFASCVSDGTDWQCSGSTAGSSSGTVSSCATGQIAYYATNGATVACLDVGTNLSISGGALNASGGGAGAPVLLPASSYTSDTAGNLFPNIYTGGGGNASPSDAGWGVAASLGADVVLQLRFQMPPSIPSGTLKLASYCVANYTGSNAIKYTVSDAAVAAGASPSSATLTAETQNTLNSWTADQYVLTKTTLSASPAANNVLVVAVTFNTSGWTLAVVPTCRWVVIWE